MGFAQELQGPLRKDQVEYLTDKITSCMMGLQLIERRMRKGNSGIDFIENLAEHKRCLKDVLDQIKSARGEREVNLNKGE